MINLRLLDLKLTFSGCTYVFGFLFFIIPKPRMPPLWKRTDFTETLTEFPESINSDFRILFDYGWFGWSITVLGQLFKPAKLTQPFTHFRRIFHATPRFPALEYKFSHNRHGLRS